MPLVNATNRHRVCRRYTNRQECLANTIDKSVSSKPASVADTPTDTESLAVIMKMKSIHFQQKK